MFVYRITCVVGLNIEEESMRRNYSVKCERFSTQGIQEKVNLYMYEDNYIIMKILHVERLENIMNLLFVQFFISAKHLRFSHQNETHFAQEIDFPLLIQNSYLTNFLQVFITVENVMKFALFDFRDLWAQ
jgi:hypothetical protein